MLLPIDPTIVNTYNKTYVRPICVDKRLVL